MMSTLLTDRETDVQLSQLDQLKTFTRIVADTADFESIREFKPQDATTNPSLVYAATQKTNYSHFLEEVLVDRRNSGLAGAAQKGGYHRSPFGAVRLRDIGNRPGSGLDGNRCVLLFRRARFDQESTTSGQAL
jgi:hypothetical protein